MISSWRKVYWWGGVTIAMFLVVAVALNPFLSAEKRTNGREMGLDFIAFYTAGTFCQQHLVGDLYDLPTVKKFQKQLAAENNLDLQNVAPWWNPPIFALVMQPLATMGFESARWVWTAINLLCLGAAAWLLVQMLPAEWGWQIRGLVPLLICISMPAIQAIGHAQNSAISLLILAASVTLAKKNRPIVSGLVLGLLSYKPQIALSVAAILSCYAGGRALGGFAVTAGAILIANLVLLPGTLAHYIYQLPANMHAIQFGQVYIWERQVTFGGFWQLLLHGRLASGPTPTIFGLTLLTDAILVGALVWVLIRSRGDERFVIAALVAMPMLMPYFLDYDLLLLAVPAVMYAGRMLESQQRWGLAAWTGLYICLLINSPIGRLTHVNLAVVMLGLLSAGMIGDYVRDKEIGAVAAEQYAPMRRAA